MLYKKSCVAVALLMLSAATQAELFNEWVSKHNKKYSTPQELEYRRQVFMDNIKLIKKLNIESTSATFAPNKFADMTSEEFASQYLRPVTAQERAELFKAGPVIRPRRSHNDLPDEFDWVDYGAVSSVKDQASCGSCWAFGATANMEGQWYLYGTDRSQKIVSFSPQNLVDCDNECMFFPSTNTTECDEGCNGGMEPNAFQWVIKNGGIMSYDDYPYTGTTGKTCLFDANNTAARFSSWTYVECDEDTLMEQLHERGPLSIGVNANLWSFYGDGVYTMYCGTANNHAVLLTGWGVTEAGVKYWIIKNSWGTSWGKNGYIWLERGVNKCGLLEMISTIIV